MGVASSSNSVVPADVNRKRSRDFDDIRITEHLEFLDPVEAPDLQSLLWVRDSEYEQELLSKPSLLKQEVERFSKPLNEDGISLRAFGEMVRRRMNLIFLHDPFNTEYMQTTAVIENYRQQKYYWNSVTHFEELFGLIYFLHYDIDTVLQQSCQSKFTQIVHSVHYDLRGHSLPFLRGVYKDLRQASLSVQLLPVKNFTNSSTSKAELCQQLHNTKQYLLRLYAYDLFKYIQLAEGKPTDYTIPNDTDGFKRKKSAVRRGQRVPFIYVHHMLDGIRDIEYEKKLQNTVTRYREMQKAEIQMKTPIKRQAADLQLTELIKFQEAIQRTLNLIYSYTGFFVKTYSLQSHLVL